MKSIYPGKISMYLFIEINPSGVALVEGRKGKRMYYKSLRKVRIVPVLLWLLYRVSGL
jgi:hypothetical protein